MSARVLAVLPPSARLFASATSAPARRVRRGFGACLVVFVLAALELGLAACASTEQGSIGAMLSRNHANGKVTIRAVPPGTGQRAGLEPGDEIVAIDGKEVRSFGTDEELRKALRGNVGTKVKLTVVREGTRRDVDVERGGGLLEKSP